MSKAKGEMRLRNEGTALDAVDRALLSALHDDARLTTAEIARRVGLSAPSVAERIRRLQGDGVLRMFTVEIDPRALGLAIQALVRIRPLPGKLHIVRRLIEDAPQIVSCDTATGEDPFIARVFAHSVEELDALLETFAIHAVTHTSVIKGRVMEPRLPPLG